MATLNARARAHHNRLITYHSNAPTTALLLLRSLLRHTAFPSPAALSSLFKSLSSSSSPLLPALHLHALALKLSLSSSPFPATALIHLYSKIHLPNDALKVFDEMPFKDQVSYAAIIVGLAQNNRSYNALSIFKSMHRAGVPSTMYCLSGALRATGSSAALELSQVIHAHALVSGFDSELVVATSLVDSYGKSGLISDARKVFDGMSQCTNAISYNALLSAYAQQGDTASTIDLFNRMVMCGYTPDEFTFLAILSSLSNAGMVREAEEWIDRMEKCYSVKPGLEHYTCLIGAMVRVARLDSAEKLALTMPFEPDAAVWRTLLSGSMVHNVAEIGFAAGRRLLELDPRDDSAYVILSNMYLSAGKKDEVAGLWTEMKNRGVKKEGGKSWIEVRGEVHVFVAGDKKHERVREIYAKLEELMEDVKEIGDCLKDDESVWYHSERLAVAFGVVAGVAPEGKAVRIVKNLRICGDCHEFFKCVSRVVEREIVVRDVNRYHRFEFGTCTCKDFW
ncbi:Tetratricopeptide-like helical domain-containing protein [Dioscorea alata]|uniref:Tetratricopeptide-like helical domain-containing protein n=1 Tax=Dioscorea alata TaxID=55571 RepID=A0ACB7WR80_DIOAL|nr:Tetratricopeptide-like helical domain-containing protein [Dioscorea alata]